MSPQSIHVPELSVVVPTYDRPEKLRNLLTRCDQQTLVPRRFELIVVDDGSRVPVAIDPAAHRFALKLLRQDNAGPAAARNLALEHCRGNLVLFLNDDSVPAFDLLEKHLAVHATRTDKVSVLGTFDFTSEALRHPFVQVLHDSDLLFDYARTRDGALHPWQYFWTSNISLPLEALREVGGFNAGRFPEASCEDVELGFRLAKRGFSVLFRKDLVCEHDHVFTADSYFRRVLRLGVNSARLTLEHGPEIHAGRSDRTPRIEYQAGRAYEIAQALTVAETYYAAANDFLEKLRRIENAVPPEPLGPPVLSELRSMVRRLSLVPYYRGQLIELCGFDPEPVMRAGPAHGKLTSVVVVSCDALEQIKACLERLRATSDPAHPTEMLCVDNGSQDGSTEYLAAQTDVLLIKNAADLGAARARNQALQYVRGDHVVFLDPNTMLTPDWLSRLLYHAEVNPRSGCIAPTADRAPDGQQVAMTCAAEPEAIAAFARRISRDHDRRHTHSAVLAAFCLLVPRRVLDAIGGFDERFTPSGYEDHDFTLRATLAGFQNRCARDVFVCRGTPDGRRKPERHGDFMQTNWERFAAKWSLTAEAVDKTDSRLAPILARRWPLNELRIPIVCDSNQPALLPRPAREDQQSRNS